MKKLFTVLAMLFVTTIALTSCSGTSTEEMNTADVSDSQSVITTLEDAKEIKLKKAVISWGDKWTVTADDVEVATIEGKAFYLIGDTYSMHSKAGNFVGAEGEKMRLVSHKADVYDFNGKKTGAISQQVISLLYKFKLTDANDKPIGEMKQKFTLGLSGDIMDTSGNKAWSFKKDLISIGSSITLKQENASEIPALTAIWMAVIASEISDSTSSSSGSSKSSK